MPARELDVMHAHALEVANCLFKSEVAERIALDAYREASPGIFGVDQAGCLQDARHLKPRGPGRGGSRQGKETATGEAGEHGETPEGGEMAWETAEIMYGCNERG